MKLKLFHYTISLYKPFLIKRFDSFHLSQEYGKKDKYGMRKTKVIYNDIVYRDMIFIGTIKKKHQFKMIKYYV